MNAFTTIILYDDDVLLLRFKKRTCAPYKTLTIEMIRQKIKNIIVPIFYKYSVHSVANCFFLHLNSDILRKQFGIYRGIHVGWMRGSGNREGYPCDPVTAVSIPRKLLIL
jgi:hypothetical protein